MRRAPCKCGHYMHGFTFDTTMCCDYDGCECGGYDPIHGAYFAPGWAYWGW